MRFFIVLRSFLAGIFFIALTLFCSLSVIFISLVPLPKKVFNFVIEFWGRSSLRLFGVDVEVGGKENIPSSSCLVLFNHTSFFDVIAMAAVIPQVRFGAKIELFKIPFFGMAMRRTGMLPIARQNPEEVFKVYEDAKERVSRGEQFALSPEGGRNYVEELLPFKSGPFIFALQAGMPIVPLVIRGAKDVMPKGHWLPNSKVWTQKIYLDFLPLVEVKNHTLVNKKTLQEEVRNQMLKKFTE